MLEQLRLKPQVDLEKLRRFRENRVWLTGLSEEDRTRHLTAQFEAETKELALQMKALESQLMEVTEHATSQQQEVSYLKDLILERERQVLLCHGGQLIRQAFLNGMHQHSEEIKHQLEVERSLMREDLYFEHERGVSEKVTEIEANSALYSYGPQGHM